MKLNSKFALVFIPTFVISGGVMTFLARRSVHKVVIESVARRAWAQLADSSEQVVPGLRAGSERMILPALVALAEKDGAAYAMAFDSQGRVVAHTRVLEQGKLYTDPLSQLVLKSRQPTYRSIEENHAPVLDVAVPIWGYSKLVRNPSEEYLLTGGGDADQRTRLGTLRMGLPLSEALTTAAQITHQLLILMGLTGTVVLFLALFLSRSILRPVRHLAKATEEIELGAYGSTVPESSRDELGDLARRFNQMSRVLLQTTVSKDFLDSILSNMLDPLIVLDPQGLIRMVNRATLDKLGYGPGELIGRPAEVLLEDRGSLVDRIVKEGFVKDVELLFRSKTGSRILMFLSGSAWHDAHGALSGVIVAAKDITERKKLEKEVLMSAKMSAVGRLASGVAHELNNPLGVILGFAQGALYDLKPGDPLELPLKSIERESNRCKVLVQELLAFARLPKTEREPVDLNRTVESALSLVTARAHLGHVNVVKDLAADLPALRGSGNQIGQVIINLANNALDAMGMEGVLTVRTRLVADAAGSWIGLSVLDTGPGIPAEILSRIFDPFFTTKPVGQGTGLGLSLVQEIVRKHSGLIEVQSRPGGTEFLVKFPLAGGSEDDDGKS